MSGNTIFGSSVESFQSLGERLTMLNAFHPVLAVIAGGALACMAILIWRRIRARKTNASEIDFRPSIGFTPQDGWASLVVHLRNRSDESVWTEEIEIVLADLIADDQTAEATLHEVQKIRQTVQAFDTLAISLVETIYKAAGKPQRKYACLMSSTVRYRAGERWFETRMPLYKLKMAGLTVVSSERERWRRSEFKTRGRSRDSQMAGTKSN